MNGWSCSPNHGPAHFTVFKNFFVWIFWSFWKTVELSAEPCSFKHVPVFFTVLKFLFVWMFCSQISTFKFMARPLSPTSFVTAQLILRRWRIMSFWSYADFQQRSNERMVVFLETRSSWDHGVEKGFRLNGVKFLKTFKVLAEPCFPKHGPIFSQCWKTVSSACYAAIWTHSSLWLDRVPQHPPSPPNLFRGVEESFRFDVMQTFNNVQTNGSSCSPKQSIGRFTAMTFVWMSCNHLNTFKFMGRAPQQLVSRPSSFCGVEESFGFDVVQTFNSVQKIGWSCSPKHGPAHFTVLTTLHIWMVWSFSKTFELMAGPCFPKHGPVLFTVLKNIYVGMLCSHVKTFKFMVEPRSPTSSVTAQHISRRWKIISF